jgi:hypothetical protein
MFQHKIYPVLSDEIAQNEPKILGVIKEKNLSYKNLEKLQFIQNKYCKINLFCIVQWKPLNVITDNVIIRLMLSVLQSPIPIGKNSNKIIRLL